MQSRGFRRWVAGLTAFCVFLTSTPFAHAAEASFWAERRAGLRKSVGESVDFRLPEAPLASASLPEGRAPRADGLPAAVAAALAGHGSLTQTHLSNNPKAPFVLLIQDAHDVEDAQRHIAAVIDGMGAADRTVLVGMEGASGPFRLEGYRAYPDKDVTRGIAEALLARATIGGPEYAGLTMERAPLLWGVEDAAAYQANVAALLEARAKRGALDNFLAEARGASDALKAKIYSPDLLTFDGRAAAYASRAEGVAAYVKYLMSVPAAGDYPNLALFLEVIRREDSLDFARVENDRRRLAESLAAGLPSSALEELMRRSLDLRAGRSSYADYYRHLRQVAVRHGVPLKEFGSLEDYVMYLESAERIHRGLLLDELARRERAVEAALARTREQKRLAAVARRLALLQKLSALAMTPEEWAAHRKAEASSPALADEVRALGGEELPALPPLSPFEDFCRLALERNEGMVKNLLAKAREEKAALAVLVAGGFHSEGLGALLTEKGTSWAVATPRIERVPEGHDYLEVFTRGPRPLEKILTGEPVAIKYPPAFAAGTDTAESHFAPVFAAAVQKMLADAPDALAGALHPDLKTLTRSVKERGGFSVSAFEAEMKGRRYTFEAVASTGEKIAVLKRWFEGRDGVEIVEFPVRGTPFALALIRTREADDAVREELGKALETASFLGAVWREKFAIFHPLFVPAHHYKTSRENAQVLAMQLSGLGVFCAPLAAAYLLGLSASTTQGAAGWAALVVFSFLAVQGTHLGYLKAGHPRGWAPGILKRGPRVGRRLFIGGAVAAIGLGVAGLTTEKGDVPTEPVEWETVPWWKVPVKKFQMERWDAEAKSVYQNELTAVTQYRGAVNRRNANADPLMEERLSREVLTTRENLLKRLEESPVLSLHRGARDWEREESLNRFIYGTLPRYFGERGVLLWVETHSRALPDGRTGKTESFRTFTVSDVEAVDPAWIPEEERENMRGSQVLTLGPSPADIARAVALPDLGMSRIVHGHVVFSKSQLETLALADTLIFSSQSELPFEQRPLRERILFVRRLGIDPLVLPQNILLKDAKAVLLDAGAALRYQRRKQLVRQAALQRFPEEPALATELPSTDAKPRDVLVDLWTETRLLRDLREAEHRTHLMLLLRGALPRLAKTAQTDALARAARRILDFAITHIDERRDDFPEVEVLPESNVGFVNSRRQIALQLDRVPDEKWAGIMEALIEDMEERPKAEPPATLEAVYERKETKTEEVPAWMAALSGALLALGGILVAKKAWDLVAARRPETPVVDGSIGKSVENLKRHWRRRSGKKPAATRRTPADRRDSSPSRDSVAEEKPRDRAPVPQQSSSEANERPTPALPVGPRLETREERMKRYAREKAQALREGRDTRQSRPDSEPPAEAAPAVEISMEPVFEPAPWQIPWPGFPGHYVEIPPGMEKSLTEPWQRAAFLEMLRKAKKRVLQDAVKYMGRDGIGIARETGGNSKEFRLYYFVEGPVLVLLRFAVKTETLTTSKHRPSQLFMERLQAEKAKWREMRQNSDPLKAERFIREWFPAGEEGDGPPAAAFGPLVRLLERFLVDRARRASLNGEVLPSVQKRIRRDVIEKYAPMIETGLWGLAYIITSLLLGPQYDGVFQRNPLVLYALFNVAFAWSHTTVYKWNNGVWVTQRLSWTSWENGWRTRLGLTLGAGLIHLPYLLGTAQTTALGTFVAGLSAWPLLAAIAVMTAVSVVKHIVYNWLARGGIWSPLAGGGSTKEDVNDLSADPEVPFEVSESELKKLHKAYDQAGEGDFDLEEVGPTGALMIQAAGREALADGFTEDDLYPDGSTEEGWRRVLRKAEKSGFLTSTGSGRDRLYRVTPAGLRNARAFLVSAAISAMKLANGRRWDAHSTPLIQIFPASFHALREALKRPEEFQASAVRQTFSWILAERSRVLVENGEELRVWNERFAAFSEKFNLYRKSQSRWPIRSDLFYEKSIQPKLEELFSRHGLPPWEFDSSRGIFNVSFLVAKILPRLVNGEAIPDDYFSTSLDTPRSPFPPALAKNLRSLSRAELEELQAGLTALRDEYADFTQWSLMISYPRVKAFRLFRGVARRDELPVDGKIVSGEPVHFSKFIDHAAGYGELFYSEVPLEAILENGEELVFEYAGGEEFVALPGEYPLLPIPWGLRAVFSEEKMGDEIGPSSVEAPSLPQGGLFELRRQDTERELQALWGREFRWVVEDVGPLGPEFFDHVVDIFRAYPIAPGAVRRIIMKGWDVHGEREEVEYDGKTFWMGSGEAFADPETGWYFINTAFEHPEPRAKLRGMLLHELAHKIFDHYKVLMNFQTDPKREDLVVDLVMARILKEINPGEESDYERLEVRRPRREVMDEEVQRQADDFFQRMKGRGQGLDPWAVPLGTTLLGVLGFLISGSWFAGSPDLSAGGPLLLAMAPGGSADLNTLGFLVFSFLAGMILTGMTRRWMMPPEGVDPSDGDRISTPAMDALIALRAAYPKEFQEADKDAEEQRVLWETDGERGLSYLTDKNPVQRALSLRIMILTWAGRRQWDQLLVLLRLMRDKEKGAVLERPEAFLIYRDLLAPELLPRVPRGAGAEALSFAIGLLALHANGANGTIDEAFARNYARQMEQVLAPKEEVFWATQLELETTGELDPLAAAYWLTMAPQARPVFTDRFSHFRWGLQIPLRVVDRERAMDAAFSRLGDGRSPVDLSVGEMSALPPQDVLSHVLERLRLQKMPVSLEGVNAPLWDGRYKLVERLSQNSASEIWRAEDSLSPGRPVILKMAQAGTGPTVFLMREYLLYRAYLAKDKNPAIAETFSAGIVQREDGSHWIYLVMEDAGRATLKDLLIQMGGSKIGGASAGLEQAKIYFPAAYALKAARWAYGVQAWLASRGILHRDFNPDNIAIDISRPSDPDGWKLIDFGVAAVRGKGAAGWPSDSVVAGKWDSMAPVTLNGGHYGPETELYAADILLSKLFTGRHPLDPEERTLAWTVGIFRELRNTMVKSWPSLEPGDALALIEEFAAEGGDPSRFLKGMAQDYARKNLPAPSADNLGGLDSLLQEAREALRNPWPGIEPETAKVIRNLIMNAGGDIAPFIWFLATQQSDYRSLALLRPDLPAALCSVLADGFRTQPVYSGAAEALAALPDLSLEELQEDSGVAAPLSLPPPAEEDGEIDVEIEMDEGPRSERGDEPTVRRKALLDGDVMLKDKVRVLVLEPDPLARSLYPLFVGQTRGSTIVSQNVGDALDLLMDSTKRGPPCDLVVLGHGLDRQVGAGFRDILADQFPNLPVVQAELDDAHSLKFTVVPIETSPASARPVLRKGILVSDKYLSRIKSQLLREIVEDAVIPFVEEAVSTYLPMIFLGLPGLALFKGIFVGLHRRHAKGTLTPREFARVLTVPLLIAFGSGVLAGIYGSSAPLIWEPSWSLPGAAGVAGKLFLLVFALHASLQVLVAAVNAVLWLFKVDFRFRKGMLFEKVRAMPPGEFRHELRNLILHVSLLFQVAQSIKWAGMTEPLKKLNRLNGFINRWYRLQEKGGIDSSRYVLRRAVGLIEEIQSDWESILKDHPDAKEEFRSVPHLHAMMNMIQQYLDGKRVDYRGNPVLVDVHESLIQAVLPWNGKEMDGKFVWVRMEAAEGMPRINVDPELLERVWINILKNAVEAGQGENVHLKVILEMRNGRVAVQWTDDGPGMDAKTLLRLGSGMTSKRESGHGIGSRVILRTVQQARGTVEILSKTAEGDAYRMRQVRFQDRWKLEVRQEESAADAPHGTTTIISLPVPRFLPKASPVESPSGIYSKLESEPPPTSVKPGWPEPWDAVHRQRLMLLVPAMAGEMRLTRIYDEINSYEDRTAVKVVEGSRLLWEKRIRKKNYDIFYAPAGQPMSVSVPADGTNPAPYLESWIHGDADGFVARLKSSINAQVNALAPGESLAASVEQIYTQMALIAMLSTADFDRDSVDGILAGLPEHLKRVDPAGAEALAAAGLRAFHKAQIWAYRLESAEKKAEESGRAAVVEVSASLVMGATPITGSEETALKVLRRTLRHLREDGKAAAALVLYDPDGSLKGLRGDAILQRLARRGKLDAEEMALLKEMYLSRRLRVLAARKDNRLIDDQGRIRTAKIRAMPELDGLEPSFFALDPAHWDERDLFVMLGGGLVLTSKEVHQSLKKLMLVFTQA